MKRTILTMGGPLLLGLFLGLAIRRARLPAPLTAQDARAQLPSRARLDAALLRAEIRDLNAWLDALHEEGEALDREKLRLAALTQPPPRPSPEALVRSNLRSLLGARSINIEAAILEWLGKDPSHIAAMIRIAAEVFREKDWGPDAFLRVQDFFPYFINNLQQDARQKLLAFLEDTQRTEPDLLKRAWMLGLLDTYQIPLPADQIAELIRLLRESKEPYLRDAAFPLLLRDPKSYADAIRETLQEGTPEERTLNLLKAWEKRALPGAELRKLARGLMMSEDPGPMIQQAQDWVPKYINPLAPQDTIALFDQTLGKPIAPVLKAVSMMVMGSVASLFPTQPGRAEIDRFVSSTDDPHLKDFGGKVLSLIDEGKGYAEIRKLNPFEFGLAMPKK